MSNRKMQTALEMEKISEDLREIYRADPSQAEKTIGTYLELILKGYDLENRVSIMDQLKNRFRPEKTAIPVEKKRSSVSSAPAPDNLLQFFTLLLGHEINESELSSADMINRLKDSLDTIFDSLNELVSAINASIINDASEDKTIRQIIGYHLGDDHHLEILANYIGRIKNIFLVTQQAFKEAAKSSVDHILKEFDPEAIKGEASGAFGVPMMKKAKYFDTFEKKYQRYQEWVASERFMEFFLREFEKKCHHQAKRLNN